MNIPLNEFEQAIDPVILERGLAYYQNNLVTDFVEIATGKYEIIVLGTLEYTVRLEIENNTIIGHECDCPYDMGPVCKHVVASLFYLKIEEPNLIQPNFIIPKKKKKKSVEQQLNDVLSKVSHEALKEFIQEQSKTDKQFRNLFLSNFAHLNESQSKEFYQRQVKSLVNSATNSHGFIGWHEMPYLEQGIHPIITIAEKQLENSNYLQVYYVCVALLEEMTTALDFSDDSNGVVGNIINNAYDMLSTIAEQEISEEVRKTIFNYCIATFKNHLLKGWDWDLETLYIAHKLIGNEKDANVVIECLSTVNDTYEQDRAQFLKLEIIAKYKGE